MANFFPENFAGFYTCLGSPISSKMVISFFSRYPPPLKKITFHLQRFYLQQTLPLSIQILPEFWYFICGDVTFWSTGMSHQNDQWTKLEVPVTYMLWSFSQVVFILGATDLDQNSSCLSCDITNPEGLHANNEKRDHFFMRMFFFWIFENSPQK